MIWGIISSTIMFNSVFLFIMLLAFKHTHLIPDYDAFLCIFLDLLSFCQPIVFFTTYVLDGHANKLYRIAYVDKTDAFIASIQLPEATIMSLCEKASRLQTIVTFRVLSEMMMRVSPVMPIEITFFIIMLKLT